MITIIEGDITLAVEKYICHQCNAMSQKSAHLAKTIFSAFPYAEIYTGRTRDGKIDFNHPEYPGNIIIRGDGIGQRYVINMIGQYYPGFSKFPDGKLDGHAAREVYFKKCLEKVSQIDNIESIAFPWQIGCGAAGGNWNKYLEMINEFSNTVSASVSIYKLKEA